MDGCQQHGTKRPGIERIRRIRLKDQELGIGNSGLRRDVLAQLFLREGDAAYPHGCTAEMLAIACRVKPAACCIVPEKRAELTTEGGLDVRQLYERLGPACDRLARAGIEVSLFIDPVPEQIETAARLGVPVIELHTGAYADASEEPGRRRELRLLAAAAAQAQACGLTVNAGHGLDYDNVGPIARLPRVEELSIGHALVAHALFVGARKATREMLERMGANS